MPETRKTMTPWPLFKRFSGTSARHWVRVGATADPGPDLSRWSHRNLAGLQIHPRPELLLCPLAFSSSRSSASFRCPVPQSTDLIQTLSTVCYLITLAASCMTRRPPETAMSCDGHFLRHTLPVKATTHDGLFLCVETDRSWMLSKEEACSLSAVSCVWDSLKKLNQKKNETPHLFIFLSNLNKRSISPANMIFGLFEWWPQVFSCSSEKTQEDCSTFTQINRTKFCQVTVAESVLGVKGQTLFDLMWRREELILTFIVFSVPCSDWIVVFYCLVLSCM